MIRSSLDIICYSRDIEVNEWLPNVLIFSTSLRKIINRLITPTKYNYLYY